MRRVPLLAAGTAALASALLASQAGFVSSAATGPLCVGPGSGCYSSVAGALAAAPPGQTIKIAPGTWHGGFVVTKSVHLVGAGQSRTEIRGGGPVITIGSGAGAGSLHVSISDLTVSGGRSVGNGFQSRGGGIDIPPAASNGIGATVKLTDVTVRGNRATATTTSPSPSGVKCPHGFCPYAEAQGGGIANSGRLTITHSTVSHNTLDGPLSDAIGGGVFSELGSLSVQNSTISGNRAAPASFGRYAEGGGLFVRSGTVAINHTDVTGNHADLVTSWPIMGQGTLIDMNANSGGVHIGDGITASITHSVISHNAISAIDTKGEPLAFDAAMLVGDSYLKMVDTRIEHNDAVTRVATSEDVGPSGTAVEFDGPADVVDSRIVGNTASQVTTHGPAAASGGLAVYDFFDNPRQVTLSHVLIEGNTATASSAHWPASALGAGVFNNSLLKLDHVTVRRNVGSAHGSTSEAQGGGIWNGAFLSGPPVELSLDHVVVTGNSLSTAPGGTRQGAGLYTTEPVQRQHTTIVNNSPDNCFGC
jgi:hypothetical protein